VTVPLDNSPSDIPPPCSIRVRVKSGVSRVKGLGLGLGYRVSKIRVIVSRVSNLVLGLQLVLGLWFGLREGGNIREGKCPGENIRHS